MIIIFGRYNVKCKQQNEVDLLFCCCCCCCWWWWWSFPLASLRTNLTQERTDAEGPQLAGEKHHLDFPSSPLDCECCQFVHMTCTHWLVLLLASCRWALMCLRHQCMESVMATSRASLWFQRRTRNLVSSGTHLDGRLAAYMTWRCWVGPTCSNRTPLA